MCSDVQRYEQRKTLTENITTKRKYLAKLKFHEGQKKLAEEKERHSAAKEELKEV